MSEIPIPIPIVPAGPGSQPSEIDGAELDILQLPSGMDTYAAPPLPEPEQVEGLTQAKACLRELLGLLRAYRENGPAGALELSHLDQANRELVDQVLGEGEVSLVIAGERERQIQESVLAGVWRIRILGADGHLLQDRVEVAAIPSLVREASFQGASGEVRMDVGTIPEGVLNATPLLAEINEQLADPGDTPYVINLTLLPQTEQDLAFLAERLGQGPVTILSRGYGNCRITGTATRHVWWVQYFNSQDRNILNTLEITPVPQVACAALEDIRDSAVRLAEILEIYQ
jgi:hydrogenase-1 operon protein HyaF